MIGVVKSIIGNSYKDKYDKTNSVIYASYSCWMEIGTTTIEDAMRKAQEFVFDK